MCSSVSSREGISDSPPPGQRDSAIKYRRLSSYVSVEVIEETA